MSKHYVTDQLSGTLQSLSEMDGVNCYGLDRRKILALLYFGKEMRKSCLAVMKQPALNSVCHLMSTFHIMHLEYRMLPNFVLRIL